MYISKEKKIYFPPFINNLVLVNTYIEYQDTSTIKKKNKSILIYETETKINSVYFSVLHS